MPWPHAEYRQNRVFAVSFQRNVRPCSLLASQLPYPVRVGDLPLWRPVRTVTGDGLSAGHRRRDEPKRKA